MLKKHARSLMQLLILVDLGVLLSAYFLGMRYAGEKRPESWGTVAVAGMLAFAWCCAATALELYESKRAVSLAREIFDGALALLLTAGTSMLAAALLLDAWPPREPLAVFLGWAVAGHLTLRLMLRSALRQFRRHGLNSRQVLLLGTNPAGLGVLGMLASEPWYGYRIVGVLDDREPAAGALPTGVRYLGTVARFAEAVREAAVDEVICALPVNGHLEAVRSAAKLCERTGVHFHLLPESAHLNLPAVQTTLIGGVPLLTLNRAPKCPFSLFAKRVLDLSVSVLVLVALLPLFAAVAALIRLDSRGPVFFRQRRAGQNGRIFSMLKFRSMVVDAEAKKAEFMKLNEADGPVFKIRADPRVTRVGRWIRRLSIDELPQFVNVLMGDMSLVGPRPPTPDEVAKYQWWERRRLSMKPGITCTWQIGGRSGVDFKTWVDMDLAYIDQWSFWLDLRILARTIPAVLSQRGAY